MKAFAVLLLVALVKGRPEPPSGYHYQQPAPVPSFPLQTQQFAQAIPAIPTNSYGAPAFGGGNGLNLGSDSGFGFSGGNGLSLSGGASSGHFVQSSGGLGGGSFVGSSNGFGSGGGGGFIGGGSSISQSSGGFASGSGLGGGGGFISGGGSNIGFGGGLGSSSGSFATGVAQAPIVQKHIYVHVPPPEPIEEQQRILSAAAPRTNYKIIFIKAPTAPAVSPAVIQQQQQSQEKTIVYVLVKKPDDQESLVLSGLAPTKPSKPEVYFIKYKSQKETIPDASLNVGSSQVSHQIGGQIGGLGLSTGGLGLSTGGLGLSTGSSGSLSTEYGPPKINGYH